MADCPSCHQDPGDGSRCQYCGARIYRYAVDDYADPAQPTGNDLEPHEAASFPEEPFPPDPVYSPPPSRPRLTPREVPTTTPPNPAPQGQRVVAAAAITFGVLILLVLAGLFLVGRDTIEQVAEEIATDAPAVPTEETEEIAWEDVVVGDCLNFADTTDGEASVVSSLERVSCGVAHEAEIFALTDLYGDEFPGADDTFAQGHEVCLAEFDTYVGLPYDDSAFYYEVFVPTAESWESGDRTIACSVYSLDGPLDRSVKGSRE